MLAAILILPPFTDLKLAAQASFACDQRIHIAIVDINQ